MPPRVAFVTIGPSPCIDVLPDIIAETRTCFAPTGFAPTGFVPTGFVPTPALQRRNRGRRNTSPGAAMAGMAGPASRSSSRGLRRDGVRKRGGRVRQRRSCCRESGGRVGLHGRDISRECFVAGRDRHRANRLSTNDACRSLRDRLQDCVIPTRLRHPKRTRPRRRPSRRPLPRPRSALRV